MEYICSDRYLTAMILLTSFCLRRWEEKQYLLRVIVEQISSKNNEKIDAILLHQPRACLCE